MFAAGDPDPEGAKVPPDWTGLADLRARAERLIGQGAYGHIELLAWNFELNDWVRIETFEPD